MRTELKSAGEALIPVFAAFHAAQHKVLTAVLNDEQEDGERLLLVFGAESLYLLCDPEMDVLDVAFGPAEASGEAIDLTADPAWSRFIGKEFFCGWFTINQQGYTDGVLLSFDGVVPEIGVNVIASSLETLELK